MPEVKEHPLIFTGESPTAILDGRKTQTRRVVARANTNVDGQGRCTENEFWSWRWFDFDSDYVFADPGPSPSGNLGPYLHVPHQERGNPDPAWRSVHRLYPIWAVGDRLWVREAWAVAREWDGFRPRNLPHGIPVFYHAGPPKAFPGIIGKVRPSIFMPRWASRITLEITEVRVQRVQEISEEDACEEGLEYDRGEPEMQGNRLSGFRPVYPDPIYAKDKFHSLWDSINAKRSVYKKRLPNGTAQLRTAEERRKAYPYSWDNNPWVWALTFKLLGETNA